MSHEFESALTAMRAEADAAMAGLESPDVLRRRGDRRTRVRTGVGLVAVAVLIAGTGIGARELLAAPSHVPLPPAETQTPITSPTPSPAAPPTQEPSPSSIAVPAECEEVVVRPYQPRVGGEALPESVMLAGRDWGRCYMVAWEVAGYLTYDPRDQFSGPEPDVCIDNRRYATDAHRVAGRARQFDGGPEIGGFESVTGYAPGKAQEFIEEIRARVAACATFDPKITQPDGDWHARIVDNGFVGDESLLIYVGMAPTGDGYPGYFYAVVRVGEMVAVVWPQKDLGGDRDATIEVARRAAGRL